MGDSALRACMVPRVTRASRVAQLDRSFIIHSHVHHIFVIFCEADLLAALLYPSLSLSQAQMRPFLKTCPVQTVALLT